MEKKYLVTSPLLPKLDNVTNYLSDIWNRKWLTNYGYYYNELEKSLKNYLKVNNISLFTNGTLPLLTVLNDLYKENGEVITTPYTFVATANAITFNHLKPVFVDVDPIYGNMDPDEIEQAINKNTVAIMPVHVYGNPCQTQKIEEIARKHNIKVIYDAAHAFGVEINGESILNAGDYSSLSFHATKVYNTVEGGALICKNENDKKRIDCLINFGYGDGEDIISYGINSKIDEIRCSVGLLNLKEVDNAIQKRKLIANTYRDNLRNIKGLRVLEDINGVKHNYSYFPIFIEEDFRYSRDQFFELLKERNIFTRKYFFPAICEMKVYKPLVKECYNLTNALKLSNQVLCLPIYPTLTQDDVSYIINTIKGLLK